jgi:hypothetical protein
MRVNPNIRHGCAREHAHRTTRTLFARFADMATVRTRYGKREELRSRQLAAPFAASLRLPNVKNLSAVHLRAFVVRRHARQVARHTHTAAAVPAGQPHSHHHGQQHMSPPHHLPHTYIHSSPCPSATPKKRRPSTPSVRRMRRASVRFRNPQHGEASVRARVPLAHPSGTCWQGALAALAGIHVERRGAGH